ncbi:MAG: MOSC N-terminal beta barrel domain-containing protein, partial [Pseudomonadales bacterium]|nr:MOSC N-terminal beta barrel domain-containing protein [Pseudomonadales bacterium]
MTRTTISEILLYPVKGGQGYAVPSARVTATGLEGDRSFAVFQDQQRVNQKTIGALHLLRAVWVDDRLQLGFPGQSDLMIDAAAATQTFTEHFRGQNHQITDMGNEVSEWLSNALGSAVRLGRLSAPSPFVIP